MPGNFPFQKSQALGSPFTKERARKQVDRKVSGLSRLLLMRSHQFTITQKFGELTKLNSTSIFLRLEKHPLLLGKYCFLSILFTLFTNFPHSIVLFYQDNLIYFRVVIIKSESAVTVSMLVCVFSRFGCHRRLDTCHCCCQCLKRCETKATEIPLCKSSKPQFKNNNKKHLIFLLIEYREYFSRKMWINLFFFIILVRIPIFS